MSCKSTTKSNIVVILTFGHRKSRLWETEVSQQFSSLIFELCLRRQKTLVLRNEDFFIHCESNGISSRVSVYIINTALPCCISSHRRCVSKIFRNDDIQNFVLMICNSCGIDDIQCFALIYFRFYAIIHTRRWWYE